MNRLCMSLGIAQGVGESIGVPPCDGKKKAPEANAWRPFHHLRNAPANILRKMQNHALKPMVPGARNRTSTPCGGDFESPASTNFTTGQNLVET